MHEQCQELRTLKAACKNLLVLSTLFLQEEDNQQRQRMIVATIWPWEEWHVIQNTRLRSVYETPKWVTEQLLGGWTATHRQCFQQLGRPDVVSAIFSDLIGLDVASLSMGHLVVVREQEFARQWATMVLRMSFARECRCLWLTRAWMSRSVLFLHHPAGEAEIARFMRDIELFDTLSAEVSRGAPYSALLRRSTFNLVLVQQLRRMVELGNGSVNERFRHWLRCFHRRCMSDQISEDQLRECRSVEHQSTTRKAPAKTCYMKLAEMNMLGTRHSFDEVEPRKSMLTRGLAFPPSAHKIQRDLASLDFSSVVGSGGARWYSPRADGLCTEVADLELLRLCHTPRGFVGLDKTWQNSLLDGAGYLLKHCSAEQWLFPLGQVPQSCGLAWPAKPRLLISGRPDSKCYELDPQGEMVFITIVRLSDFVAVPIEVMAPVAASIRCLGGGLSSTDIMQIRFMVPVDAPPEQPLLMMAARKAFWSLPITGLKKFADELGLEYERGCTLFDMLFLLVESIIGSAPEETLAILASRLSVHSEMACLNEQLLQIDEGFELLHRDEATEAFVAHDGLPTATSAGRYHIPTIVGHTSEVFGVSVVSKCVCVVF